MLARSANAAEPYAKHTTADTDIVRRRFFFVDLDSIRAAGISATDAEHEAALQLALRLRAYLTERGWPAPIMCDSGNGAWLIYPINLPNDAAATALIKRVLEALALTFDDETVAVDRTTFNAGRIVKIPGTVARKGSDLTERPHCLSRVIDAGSTDVVGREQLEEIAALIPDPPPRNSNSGRASQSLAEWIAAHGIAVRRELPWNGGTRFILERCLFDSSHHGTSAALIELAGSAKVYRCLHNGCVDRKWSDVRELFESGYRERSRARPGADHHGEQEDQPDDEPSGAEVVPPPDPIDLDTPNPDPMPHGIFPEWGENYINAVAAETETPRELAAAMELGNYATANQRKVVIEIKQGYREALNLFLMPAMDSGNRKTAVVGKATGTARRWQSEQIEKQKPLIVQARSFRETEQARIAELRKQAAKAKDDDELTTLKGKLVEMEMELPQVPPSFQIIAGGDCTIEKLDIYNVRFLVVRNL